MRTGTDDDGSDPTPTGASRPVLTRRALLGATTAAVALTACGQGSDDAETGTSPTPQPSVGATVPPTNATDAVGAALAAVGLEDAELALTPQSTWSELLVGVATNLLFVVTDDAGELVTEPVDAWLVGLDGEVAVGPLTSTWYPDDRLPTEGLHAIDVSLDEAASGVFDFVVASPDGARAGTAGIQALPPEESLAPANGQQIPAVATPTTDDEMGLEELCTREENCGLHDVSLDEALGGTSPVVLCISTPKYCATAICGPVLEDVLSVAGDEDAPEAIFIHAEPYVDADLTPTALVDELQLPTEPWTYVLQPDGVITERYPGPVLPDLLRAALAAVPLDGGGGTPAESDTGSATPSPSPTSSET